MFLSKPFLDKFMSTEPKPSYSPGLAGVIAGETEICWVDPNAGLMYRGYDIHEMASKASFEEVAYLLLNGELPTGGQLANFTNQLSSERALPEAVIKMMRRFAGRWWQKILLYLTALPGCRYHQYNIVLPGWQGALHQTGHCCPAGGPQYFLL